MKNVLLGLVFLLVSATVMGQSDYKAAIGGRLAPTSYYDFMAFSYKAFVTDAGALEFNAGGGRRGYYYEGRNRHPFTIAASGSYQHHFKIPLNGLQWFVGGGLTAYNAFHGNTHFKGFGFAFFPLGGIDWKVPNIPLNLSADYRPSIFVTRPSYLGDSFEATQFGFSVRYTLGGR
ncbi:MAG: hypothetical protein KIT80_10590 [Chitinophagaceae bacterium]|nr:hypothetical protein [Chitinophagaceae bacterium]MCW5927349.1 hypothetical protein [Chitinophagaceae bacterium]